MKVLIITDDDADGIMSAQCLKQIHATDEVTICYTRQQNSLDAANTFNLKDFDKVYVTDLSITEQWCDNANQLLNTDKCVSSFVVIDHHKSADWLRDKPYAIYDTTRSACLITAEFYGMSRAFLNLANYISDRDIWEFKFPFTKAVHEYIHLFDLKNYDTMNQVAHNVWEHSDYCLNTGNLILNAKQRKWKERAKQIQEKARRVNLGYIEDGSYHGYSIPIVNLTNDISETLHEVLQLGFICAASYFINDKGEVIISLRSTDGSALKIAKYSGGGGHDNAAGFKMNNLGLFKDEILGD